MYISKNETPLADPRALIAEDDRHMLQVLKSLMSDEGYAVDTCMNGEDALYKLTREGPYDVALLDSVMPQMTGVEVVQLLRRSGMDTPVIIVSGRSLEHHRIEGLEEGADDYITKPFSSRELIARVFAVRRRSEASRTLPKKIVLGNLFVDFEAREALRDGALIHITPTEWDMLRYMAYRKGASISREELKVHVLKIPVFIKTRSVDRHAYALRCKIDLDPKKPRHIMAVIGIGYRLANFELLE